MIKYDDTKVSANEYAKLFLVDCIIKIEDNIDSFIELLNEDFSDFSNKEKNDFKEQLSKKVTSVKSVLGYDKLIQKVK
jgi:hypothetical protein